MSIKRKEKIINKEFNDRCKLYSWILYPLGLWPREDKLLTDRRDTFKMIFIVTISLYVVVPTSLKIILENKDPVLILKMGAAVGFIWMCILQYILLARKSPEIYRCIDSVRSFWKYTYKIEEKESILKYHKIGLRHLMWSAFIMHLSGMWYYMMVPYAKSFRMKSSTEIVVFYLVQFISSLVVQNLSVSVCALVALFLTNASARVDIVMKRINWFVLNFQSNRESNEIDYAKLFYQHWQTLRFAAQIKTILNLILFIQVCSCTLFICLVGFFFLTEMEDTQIINTVTYCMLLCAFISHIFMTCCLGEEFEFQYKNVGNAFWSTNWYTMSRQYVFCGMMFIMISSISLKMKALIFKLTLSCFAEVMRSSLYYLNFLRKTM